MDPQQKAAGFNSFLAIVRAEVAPDAFERMVAALPPDSAALVTKPAFATAWIPMVHANPVVLAVASQLLGGSDERLFQIGRRQFIEDIGGIYKLFIRIASPAYVAARAGKIYDTYNRDAGTMRVLTSASHSLDVVIENHPMPSRPVWQYVRGCIAGTLELTGVKDLVITITEGGERESRCLFHVTWK